MTRQRRTLLRLLAALVAFVLIAAACSDDSGTTTTGDSGDTADSGDSGDTADSGDSGDSADSGDSGDTGDSGDSGDAADSGDDAPALTASFRGVTEDTINIGVTMLDFAWLVEKGFSPAGWGDQQAIYQALIDHINDNGGVLGRKLNPSYEFYKPITLDGSDDGTRACIALTEDNDDEIFAVIGGFVGPANTANKCFTDLHETALFGGNMNPIDLASARAPWYQAGAPDFANTFILLGLLDQAGELDGAKVFVMGGSADQINHQPTLDALADHGVEVVGDAIIVAEDGDTAGQDSELQIITEQIKNSGATAVFIHGTPSASIRGLGAAGLTGGDLEIWSNNPGGLANLGKTITDKSIADGVKTVGSAVDAVVWASDTYQQECSQVVEAADIPGADIRDPATYAEDEENWFNQTRQACRALWLFVDVASAAGPDLTYDSLVAGANTLTDFALPGSNASSLGPDKPYADDEYVISVYDHTAGDGMPVPVGELVDVFP